VYAAGDVIGFPALASTSMEQARVAVCHAFGIRYKRAVATVIPYGLYTIPEISMIGETESEARKLGVDVEIGIARYDQNARGRIAGDREGFVKLVFESESKKLLGAHLFGERSTELVHVAQPVLHFEGTIDYFIDAVFNYPSLAETFKYAAYDGLGRLHRRETSCPPG
jgi:NAD(P) transhydrogenase